MDITLGQIAGIIAALALVILVIALIRPISKLSKVLDGLAGTVTQLTEHTLPALDEAVTTVRELNGQVERLDSITAAVSRTVEDVSALTTVVTSTVGAPFVAVRKGTEKVKETFSSLSSKASSFTGSAPEDPWAPPADSSEESSSTPEESANA